VDKRRSKTRLTLPYEQKPFDLPIEGPLLARQTNNIGSLAMTFFTHKSAALENEQITVLRQQL